MIWLWTIIMSIWWGTGFVGLVLAVAGLRVAIKKQRMMGRSGGSEIARGLATRLIRVAVGRTVVFTFLFLNAPIVYFMFDVTRRTGMGDVVPAALPFGVIAFAGAVVAVSEAVLLFLALLDLRDAMHYE